ncbi:MAG: F0F1 ATP synthase subunit delta [Propionibacteriaceae bacterium]|nr:F0F1 ATP synthase subunit delta [Propionibacteriaceae bacterium]
MNATAEARQSELDRALDAQELGSALAVELFAVADLLTAQPQLRNALADSTMPDDRRRELATGFLGPRVSAAATAVVAEAAALRWGSPSGLVAALERQGVRALLGQAQATGKLDTVEEELFRFSRTVVGDQALRRALDDRRAPRTARRQLVSDLLDGRVEPTTVELAARATGARARTYEATLADYLKLAAAARARAIAKVTVARDLTAAQRDRLQEALVRQLGRQVNLQVVVDPSVIGGARVQVGDEVIEGTVAGKLAAAEQQLL